MSDYTNSDLRQLDHVEDLLEAYADARLSPSGPVLSRIRTNAMAHAAAAAVIGAGENRGGEPASLASRWRLPQLQVPRRAFALGLAATMSLGTGAAVLAAPPGSPFYNARIVIGAAFLPAQLDARLASHEQRLGERLLEAEAAAASGNGAALAAALAAYAAEIDAAIGDVGDDADRLAHLEAVLARHVALLTALQAEVPEEASVDQAIDSSQRAVEKIKDKKNGGGGGRPSGPPAGPENQPGRG